MIVKTRQIDRLRVANFYAFYVWAFAILHPNKPMKPEQFIAGLAFAMEEFARGRRRRQLIAVPPRHGKSLMASVALCAWILGRDPSKKILVASYGSELAAKHGRDFRTIVNHPEFKRMFPACRIVRNGSDDVETSKGGIRKAVTPNSATTGFGADFVIIDDLTKVGDARSESVREAANAYVDESLYTRFDEKANGGILAIQQRTHERDVIGHLRDKGEWHELFLPAIAQERQIVQLYGGQAFIREPGDVLAPSMESAETLLETKAMMGAQAFSAQYLQNPVAPGGNRIQSDWFLIYDEPPARHELQYVIQSWDTALSELPDNDYSVCVTLGYCEGHWYILDVLRRRMSFTTQVAEAKRLYGKWQPDRILIERASTGGALAQQLCRELNCGRGLVNARQPRSSKEERVEVYSHLVEDGLVAIPDMSSWTQDFLREMTAFPYGKHDDQVDALFHALEWIESRHGRANIRIDPYTHRRRTSSRPCGRGYEAYCA